VSSSKLSNDQLSKNKAKQRILSLSNIRLPWLIFTLIIFAGLMKLGFWQTERAVEKEQRLIRITELQQQQAISLSQVLALNAQKSSNLPASESTDFLIDADYFNDFPLELVGDFNSEQVFLLDNQVNKNQLGYRILQVAMVDDYAVLVNLGWLAGSIDRNVLPEVTPLAGNYRFKGNMRFVETGIMLMEQNFDNFQWPLRIQQVELTKFSKLIDAKLLPFVVYLDKKEDIGFEKNWHPIVMPPEKHRGYAFQWFSLAVAWLLLMIWAAKRAASNKIVTTNTELKE